MKAGELRHRVTIESCIVAQNEHGQEDLTWRAFTNRLWARISQTGSRELWHAQQQQPDITHMVVLRWLEGVDAKMRLVWHDGKVNRILAIEGPPLNPDGRRLKMTLLCKEQG